MVLSSMLRTRTVASAPPPPRRKPDDVIDI
jgi:hypothetical protein